MQMRILRSILGVLLVIMLSQRYKANELDLGPAWAAVPLILIKLDQVPLQNFKLIHHSLFSSLPVGLLCPLLFRVLCSRRARGKMENGKIQDFRKCGDKLCGGWLGGQFYSTLSFLIGSCRSQTLHFMRARGGRGTPPHNQEQEERRQPRGNENTT